MFGHSGGARSRAAAPPHRQEPTEVTPASILDASLSAGEVFLILHWDLTQRKTRTHWKYDVSEPGTTLEPSGRAGEGECGSGSLGFSAQT